MMSDDLRHDWSIHSPEWAYNQPGWKPYCVRCHTRKADCRKYNSDQPGQFAGEWICATCRVETDTLTPCEKVYG